MKQTNWAHAIAMQVGVVPLSFGPPGVGKTAFHRFLADLSHRDFIQLILRQRTPEDIGGIPVVQRNGELTYVEYVKSAEMQLAECGKTVLLLDEFNHATPDVMGAAQELINNPPPECWMAACANPLSQATDGHELAPAVVNRMVILEWELDLDECYGAWTRGNIYAEPELPMVPDDYMQTASVWGGVIRECRDQLDTFINIVPVQGDVPYPFPTVRSITNFIRLMAACDAVGANDATRSKIGIGTIGNRAWHLIDSQMRAMEDQPVEDPATFDVPDEFMAARRVVTCMVAAVRKDRDAWWVRARQLAGKVFYKHNELGISMYEQIAPMRIRNAPVCADSLSRFVATN